MQDRDRAHPGDRNSSQTHRKLITNSSLCKPEAALGEQEQTAHRRQELSTNSSQTHHKLITLQTRSSLGGTWGLPQTGTGANSTRGREDSTCRSQSLGRAGRRMAAPPEEPVWVEDPSFQPWQSGSCLDRRCGQTHSWLLHTPQTANPAAQTNTSQQPALCEATTKNSTTGDTWREQENASLSGFVEELDGSDVSAGLQRAPPQ